MQKSSHGGTAMLEKTGIQSGLKPQVSKQNHGQQVSAEHKRNTAKPPETIATATDQVSISYSKESLTTYDSAMTLKGSQNDGFDLLRGLVINILKEQGIALNISTGTAETEIKDINLEELTQEEAAELIADDGYFGVEQTSDRIVDFAIGIAGGDPARIDAIMAGVEQGFNEALEVFGGSLPDISYSTYDAVIEKLNAWVADSKQEHA
jgi:hypothetical protein